MAVRDEEIIEANFVINFAVDIENITSIASSYITLYFNLNSFLKTKDTDLTKPEAIEILINEQKSDFEAFKNFLNSIRILANKIFIRYQILKNEYAFEDVEKEYNDIFSEEIIEPKKLTELITKFNKAYYKISDEVRMLRNKVKQI